MNWRRFNGEPIHLKIKDQVRLTIEEEVAKNNKLSVYIGTDSQVKQTVTEFATVIVFSALLLITTPILSCFVIS
jgi:predicted RNase H-related nuclease YkuK (DUF458 family)